MLEFQILPHRVIISRRSKNLLKIPKGFMSRKLVLYLPLGLPIQLHHPCTTLYDMNAALKVAKEFMCSSVNKLTASLTLWHLNGMSCYGFQAERIFGLLFCSQVYTLFMFPFRCPLYNNPPLIVCRPPSFSSHH